MAFATESVPRTKLYSFKLPMAHYEALKAVETKTGATVAEQVRRGIVLWLKQQKKVSK